jgi:hypothetical protein
MVGLYVVVSSYIFHSQFEHLKRRRRVLPGLRNSSRTAATSNQAREAPVCVCVCVCVFMWVGLWLVLYFQHLSVPRGMLQRVSQKALTL